jgi:hypothetical protein
MARAAAFVLHHVALNHRGLRDAIAGHARALCRPTRLTARLVTRRNRVSIAVMPIEGGAFAVLTGGSPSATLVFRKIGGPCQAVARTDLVS